LKVAKVLTQRQLETAQPGVKRYGLRDGIVPGMQVIVYPTGKKVGWLWDRLNGVQTSFEVGDASLMTLAELRAKGRAFKAAIANGEDPRAVKAEKAKVAADTVEAVGKSFIERHVKAHNKRRTAESTNGSSGATFFPSGGAARSPASSLATSSS
jgi:hypothetical protein